MNKICVSVCAENADEFIKNIKRAEEFADVIELRFDCLKESEFDLALQEISESNYKKPFLATFRPNKDAEIIFGRRINQTQETKERIISAQNKRFDNWKKISVLENIKFIDFETDLQFDFCFNPTSRFSIETLNMLKAHQIIISEHDFNGVPNNLKEVYENMLAEENDGLRCDIIKIAVATNDITDSITIWKLLERAKAENKQFIPIAMGEAGKWTRILGLAHAAFMTYASLDSGNETAPGQVSAKDLIKVYRAKELDENTEVYGIIGNPVSHSVSPEMQNAAFKFHKLNAVYIPFEVNNLDEFMTRMVKPETREIELNFKGFSVTIPHKENIIKHLDFIDETAKAIGAVNTVKIIDGKLYGYNTDAQGFIDPLKRIYGELKDANVAILGAGGAARACVYALKKEGANITLFARSVEKAKDLANAFEIEIKELPKVKDCNIPMIDFNNFDILLNTTPLGMKGDSESETPVFAEHIKNVKLVYDLVFNPLQTPLMNEADQANIPKIGGLEMLVAQGALQQKIWTGKDAPLKEMNEAALNKLQ